MVMSLTDESTIYDQIESAIEFTFHPSNVLQSASTSLPSKTVTDTMTERVELPPQSQRERLKPIAIIQGNANIECAAMQNVEINAAKSEWTGPRDLGYEWHIEGLTKRLFADDYIQSNSQFLVIPREELFGSDDQSFSIKLPVIDPIFGSTDSASMTLTK